MKIAILDQTFGRAIIAQVPEYLSQANVSSETIAHAIFDTLGIDHDTEYMIGDFQAHMDGATYNEDKTGMYTIDELASDFKNKALEALSENID